MWLVYWKTRAVENVKLSPSLGKIDANAREGWRLAGAIAFNKLPSQLMEGAWAQVGG